MMQMRAVGDAMAIAMRDVEKIDRKILVADSFHHGHKALQGRARGAPVRPTLLPGWPENSKISENIALKNFR